MSHVYFLDTKVYLYRGNGRISWRSFDLFENKRPREFEEWRYWIQHGGIDGGVVQGSVYPDITQLRAYYMYV